jgi:hypothetical protein
MVGSREVLVVRMMASSWELSVRVLVARMAMTDGVAVLPSVSATSDSIAIPLDR